MTEPNSNLSVVRDCSGKGKRCHNDKQSQQLLAAGRGSCLAHTPLCSGRASLLPAPTRQHAQKALGPPHQCGVKSTLPSLLLEVQGAAAPAWLSANLSNHLQEVMKLPLLGHNDCSCWCNSPCQQRCHAPAPCAQAWPEPGACQLQLRLPWPPPHKAEAMAGNAVVAAD